ncbi:tripartite tricarboxylate transporter substrate binding protein [Radiobacillus kanasensis]|uniref:tripartite tricarboxylate transporter substrate binding protein n=1 Tax=Radiobacillus kanasensis TaxID=2844358 RepID=UPI001E33D12E|nr:tripartite tricarboxylate transporter substrate binding protein [Radiobacillus kanasensis]UFU01180.1 tripartite tricarboxylate transporter substrate binding protein [Radiobacillus kanasensis]
MKKYVMGFIVLAFLFGLVGCSKQTSSSEDFPEKSIQMIVAFSPGAATDTQARIIAKHAEKYLGQELVIVNKPGGGGQVGWNEFSTVKKDGYTLAAYNLPHIITQPLVSDTTFQLDTFEPLINWGGDPTVFAVKGDSDIQTLEDLIAKAKESPNSVTIGNPGKYVGQHLATLLLEQAAGIQVEAVPYQGSSDAIAALLGGHIDAVAGNLSDIYRLGDDVTALAIGTEERHSFMPDLPTFKELGYPSVIMSTDRGIAAVKGTPPEIIAKLEEAFLKIMEDEEFLADMEKAGADMLIMNRDEAIEDMKKRQENYKALLETIDIPE